MGEWQKNEWSTLDNTRAHTHLLAGSEESRRSGSQHAKLLLAVQSGI